MAWIKVQTEHLDAGDLPPGTVEPYVRLARLAMALRGRRQGDRFVAARSAVVAALNAGNWPNARRALEKLARLSPVIAWREVSETTVEISLAAFERDQGFDAGGGGAGPRGAPGPVPAEPRARRGLVGGPRRSKRPKSRRYPEETTPSQEARTQESRGDARTRAGEELPEAMPAAVRAHLLEERQRLHASVRPLLEDPGYLAHEWARFVRHHRRERTVVRSLEAVATRWFKDDRTGESARDWAHHQRKRDTEALAS